MKVFISWSGPQSNYIARALRGWLCEVIQSLDLWMSELDIEAGQRWPNELWRELQDSHFGVVCLTAENLQSTWLHYEAAALAKTGEVLVCPYLYKIEPSAVKGPLSHLQMVQANEEGTKDLVQSINTVIKRFSEKGLLTNEKILSTEQVDKAFSRCWSELEKKLKAVPSSTTAPPRDIPQEEATRIKEERKRRVLEILAERERTVPPIDSDIGDNLFDILKKRAKDRSAFPNLETFLSKEPPPPSDTSQKGKLPPK